MRLFRDVFCLRPEQMRNYGLKRPVLGHGPDGRKSGKRKSSKIQFFLTITIKHSSM